MLSNTEQDKSKDIEIEKKKLEYDLELRRLRISLEKRAEESLEKKMKKKKKKLTRGLDMRQIEFFRLYSDPKSLTFNKAGKSAVAAGFSESTGRQILKKCPPWFVKALEEMGLLKQAETNLAEFLAFDNNTSNNTKLRIKADITKYVASTLGREKYTTRVENLNVDVSLSGDLDSEQMSLIAKRMIDKNSGVGKERIVRDVVIDGVISSGDSEPE